MVDENTSRFGTAFAVTIEAIGHGVTTGISAYDRATTIRLLCDEHAKPSDFAKPGHMFPLRAAAGGVLERAGQTEAIVDLCKLAGRFPAGVICEVMRDDGRMARRPDLDTFGAEHGIKIVSVADLIAYRRRNERLVVRGATTTLPTEYGTVTAVAYEDVITHATHVALVWGDVRDGEPVLVCISERNNPLASRVPRAPSPSSKSSTTIKLGLPTNPRANATNTRSQFDSSSQHCRARSATPTLRNAAIATSSTSRIPRRRPIANGNPT